ncbi:MAG: erythromycin esterase family protein [Blastocatellia bacterium]
MNRLLKLPGVVCWLVLLTAFAAAQTTPREATMKELDAIVGDAQYVNFGEDSHFMVGVHQFVSESFRHLAETKKFRVFVFESAWGIEDAFADFMKSDRTTVTPEESFFLNAFNSKAIVEMLVWIRDWNRQHPNDQIRIAGYQPEQPVTDFNALWKFLGEPAELKTKAAVCRAGTGEFKTNIEFISSTSKRRRGGQPTYTTEERAACNQALDAIASAVEQKKATAPRNNYLEATAHIKSLRTYLNTLTWSLDQSLLNKNPSQAEQKAMQKKIYEEGDKTRFEIFEILRQTRYASKKIYFWMHNWHAMKYAPEVDAFGRDESEASMPAGTISLGTRMAQAYGSRLIVIGNIVPKAVCKNPICTAPAPPRADLLETKFAEHFGKGSALVNLRKPTAADRQLPLAVAGSLYADINQGHFSKVILKRQFDAIYYLSETTATFEQK